MRNQDLDTLIGNSRALMSSAKMRMMFGLSAAWTEPPKQRYANAVLQMRLKSNIGFVIELAVLMFLKAPIPADTCERDTG